MQTRTHGLVLNKIPQIQDALFQAFITIHEAKQHLEKLKEELMIGGEVPLTLLHLFGLTSLASKGTLKFSRVKHYSIQDNQMEVEISLLTVSSRVDVLKADAFTYLAIDNGLMCQFRYSGPEYVLYNHTSDCVRPVLKAETIDGIVSTEKCVKRKAMAASKPFEPHDCKRMTLNEMKIPEVQLKHDGTTLRINCQGHTIVMNNRTYECPNHIFNVQDEQMVTIDGFSYRHESSHVSSTLGRFRSPNET